MTCAQKAHSSRSRSLGSTPEGSGRAASSCARVSIETRIEKNLRYVRKLLSALRRLHHGLDQRDPQLAFFEFHKTIHSTSRRRGNFAAQWLRQSLLLAKEFQICYRHNLFMRLREDSATSVHIHEQSAQDNRPGIVTGITTLADPWA